MKSVVKAAAVCVLSLVLGSCASQSASPGPETPPGFTPAPSDGISGQTAYTADSYLVVHDRKHADPGVRIAILHTFADAPTRLQSIIVNDWQDGQGRSNDLEAVCQAPGRQHEFVLAEAGSWEGRFGRLFHVRVDPQQSTARVLGVSKLPWKVDNDRGTVGDQFEGMECVARDDNSLFLILAERGGSTAYPTGLLYWATLDLGTHQLSMHAVVAAVEAPGDWTRAPARRHITDLYLDADMHLWASASEELGDSGAFKSVIYEVGAVTPESTPPVRVNTKPGQWREVAGFKIEALAGPSSAVPESTMSFATEDEIYGGVWRAVR